MSPARRPLWFRFDLCGQPCRLELSAVLQVLPWADLEPATSTRMEGWLNLHGERIPVFDLNHLLGSAATERVLGSRLLLMRCPPQDPGGQLAGVIVSGLFDVLEEEAVEDAERFHPCDVLSSVLGSLE